MFKGFQRKSGGQPGNQNARKHGFYSHALKKDEKSALKGAEDLDGLDQEIAVLRIKFRSLISEDQVNLRLINQTAETLAKLCHIKSIFYRSDSSKVKDAIRAVMDEFVIPGSPDNNNQTDQ
jgi:hypothetical protein